VDTTGQCAHVARRMAAWEQIRGAVAATGRAVAGVGGWVGQSAAAAYRAVDPDLRHQLAQLPVVGLTLLAPSSARVEPLPDDGHRPVVFVAGLGGTRGNFLPLRWLLWLAGRRRTYALACDTTQTIDRMAVGFAAFVQQVVRRNKLPPGAKVDVVAHSMGGLIARLAIEDERVRSRIGTLVTMGTPHSGSHLARFGAFANAINLRPESAVVARLEAQVPWRGPPSQPRLVCLWSRADVIVLPAGSARVEGAENVELTGFTHYSYLLDPTAAPRLLAALAPARRNRPGIELTARRAAGATAAKHPPLRTRSGRAAARSSRARAGR
jgi:pimeloyl-ACP methyl ester carboxylesterase